MPATYRKLGGALRNNTALGLLYSNSTRSSIVSTISIANSGSADAAASLYVATPAAEGAGVNWSSRGSQTVYGAAYAFGNYWISGGLIKSSTDGITWSNVYGSLPVTVGEIIYEGGNLVAVGDRNSKFVSTDGITWTSNIGSVGSTNLNAITYGNGLYVAVGDTGVIQTSTNGTTWSNRTSNTADILYATGYGNGIYLAGGANDTLRVSTDAITWTTQSFGTGTVTSIFYNAGTYFLGTASGLKTSTNTLTWTTVSNATIYDMEYANNLYVGSGSLYMYYSTDGVTWSRRLSGMAQSDFIRAVTYGNGQFIAGGATFSGGALPIMFSGNTTSAQPDTINALLLDTVVEANSTVNLTFGMGLQPNSQLWVGNSTASTSLTFHAFGMEIS